MHSHRHHAAKAALHLEFAAEPVLRVAERGQQRGVLRVVKGADLMQVVDALNALGATPQDLMSILEALKAAGALRAELEIL